MRLGNASAVNIALFPSWMPPMSLSLTLVSTCILVRSVAIRNNVGVWRLAATVCPIVTLRDTTVPSTGENDIGIVEVALRSRKLGFPLLDCRLVEQDLR